MLEYSDTGLNLPPVLDLTAAAALLEAFLARRGHALAIDGGNVQRLGGQCLQVMLAARAAWAADDQDLSFENCSGELLAALELLGVAAERLTYRKEISA